MLTPAQIDLIRKSWHCITASGKYNTAKEFYNCLFEMAPEVKTMFSSDALHMQPANFFTMMDYLVSNLHDNTI